MLYNVIIAIVRVLARLLLLARYEGMENIPKTGPVVICSNHFHWADPFIVACATRRKVHYMAKTELFEIPIIGAILPRLNVFPVKRGTADRTAIRHALNVLASGGVLALFPEGTRSKSGELQGFYNGTAYFAVKSDAPIVPVGIVGKYQLFSGLKVRVGKPINVEKDEVGRSGSQHLADLSHTATEQIAALVRGE